MKPGTTHRLRIVLLVTLGAAYAVAAHLFTSNPGMAEYGAILSVTPWLAIGLALAWQSKQRNLMILGCLGLLIVLYLKRDALLENYAWVYFVQHAGSFLALAIAFGRTLARDREPMCTRFARTVRGTLSDDVSRYTRLVTTAWTAFFAVLCLVSAGLFALAPVAVWSFFANLLTPILVCAMFGAEYLVRLRMLPKLEHRGAFEAVRSIWAASSTNATSSDAR